MNKLWICFLMFTCSMFSQENVEGVYGRYLKTDYKQYLYLENENKFTLMSNPHYGGGKSTGEWVLNGNELVLFYDLPEPKRAYQVDTYKSKSLTDSIQAVIVVKDNVGIPVFGIEIFIPSLNLSGTSNNKGEVNFSLKKSNQRVQVETRYIGFLNSYFVIDRAENNFINLTIDSKSGESFYVEKETLTFSEDWKSLKKPSTNNYQDWVKIEKVDN